MSGTNCNNIVDTAVEATSSTNNHHQPSSSSSSSTFLASENLCGQTLLSLVGKGHSILANIRILSERVPCAFLAAASLDKRENDGGGNGRSDCIHIVQHIDRIHNADGPNNGKQCIKRTGFKNFNFATAYDQYRSAYNLDE